jgi:two-component system, NtrC family, sensor histidine kinase HydH
VADADARAFRRTLSITLGILGLLTAGAVLLFGHLLFKALSKDVVNDALLHTKLDAERIARGVHERTAGDPYVLELKRTEIDRFVQAGLSERQILTEVEIRDSATHQVLYSYGGRLIVPESLKGPGAEVPGQVPVPPQPLPRTFTLTESLDDPYDIEVPIGDFAVLRFGVSRRELERRVEKLRKELYLRTFAAASVSLLGIAAASAAVILLFKRTRRIEEAHLEAERRAELGEVAAGLAHEIRNPLNAMNLNLELLEEQLQRASGSRNLPPGAAADLAHAARVETGRLARLLTDFLSYARPTPIVPVPADLNEPAGEAVAFLAPEAEKRRIRLEFVPHPGGAPAKLDVGRVKQVVLNLVANALDAVEAEGAEAREVRVVVDDDGAFWRLTVTDRGPGVPSAKAGDLFKLFVSTKPAGTGLGLPIAERIVKGHGGTLALVSKPGEPTRAVATFPKAD